MNYGGGTTVGRALGGGLPLIPLRLDQGDTFRVSSGDYGATYHVSYPTRFETWASVRAFMQRCPHYWTGDVFAIMAALTAEYGQ